jgi:TPR repeat protein
MAGLTAGLAPAVSAPATGHMTDQLITELDSTDVIALQRSASQGDFSALLRLGEIYDAEHFKQRDFEKACGFYIRVTERAGKFDRFHPEASRLAAAFRRAADCYLEGVGTPNGVKDVNEAGKLLFHSGAILEDAESLFKLGKLFLAPDGIGPNLGMATRFLDNAARKQYPPAQALLGSMMWEGKVTKHQPAAGLALLILGKERTQAKDRAWITLMHDDAIMTAAKDVEREARQLVEKWKAVHSDTVPTAAPLQQIVIPTPSKAPGRVDASGFADASDELVNKTKESHSPASAEAVPEQ